MLQLHKLLYYCQGWRAHWTGEPMFHEDVQAWTNGPVVSDLWCNEAVDPMGPTDIDLGETTLQVVGYVVGRYGSFSGRDLIRLTHSEDPWRNASESETPNPTITVRDMAQYFAGDEQDLRIKRLMRQAFADDDIRERIEKGHALTGERFSRSNDVEPVEAGLETLTSKLSLRSYELRNFDECVAEFEVAEKPDRELTVTVLNWILGLRTDPYRHARPEPTLGRWFAEIPGPFITEQTTVASYAVDEALRTVSCSTISTLEKLVTYPDDGDFFDDPDDPDAPSEWGW